MHNKTISELSRLLHRKEVSALEIADYFLNHIEKNDRYNAVINCNEEKTWQDAHYADRLLHEGKATPLTGIPIVYKDLFCHQGWQTSAASKMLANFTAPYSATVVEALQQQGMIAVGRANMDEFAMGSTTESSYWGATLNPWDHKRVPGGSSGGSAAAVASRLVPVSLGSDSGGSIRQPSSFCGVTGIKPSYGLVSRYGMVAYASSFDQAGPIARTAEDCALILNAIIGFDPKDSTSVVGQKKDYSALLNIPIKGMKVGLPKEFYQEKLFKTTISEEVVASLFEVKALLQDLGVEIVEVSLPLVKYAIPAYYVLVSAEASTNLQRYDGVRYGYRTEKFTDLESFYSNTRAEGFGWEVKRRILLGTYVLSHGFYEAYYLWAQKVRRLVAEELNAALDQCDVLLSPTAGSVAPPLNTLMKDPAKMYADDVYTLPVNLAGLPALTLPGPLAASGLPVGAQLIGSYQQEDKLLCLAHQIQQHSNWHQISPITEKEV